MTYFGHDRLGHAPEACTALASYGILLSSVAEFDRPGLARAVSPGFVPAML